MPLDLEIFIERKLSQALGNYVEEADMEMPGSLCSDGDSEKAVCF